MFTPIGTVFLSNAPFISNASFISNAPFILLLDEQVLKKSNINAPAHFYSNRYDWDILIKTDTHTVNLVTTVSVQIIRHILAKKSENL